MRQVAIQHARGVSEVPVWAGGEPIGPESRDPVTGLPDEAALRARTDQLLDAPEPDARCAALVTVDCGGLAEIERQLGADGVRRMRRELARRLRGHAGPCDFLSQAGDSRFTLLLGGLDEPASAERVAGAIVHDLTRPVRLETRDAVARAHVGVAIAPTHGRDAETLLAAARQALLEALHLGGDTYLLAR